MRRGRGRGRPLLRTARERPNLKRLSENIGQPFPIPFEPGPPSPPAFPNRPHYTRPHERTVTRPGASRIDRSAGVPPHSPVRRVRHANSRPGGTAVFLSAVPRSTPPNPSPETDRTPPLPHSERIPVRLSRRLARRYQIAGNGTLQPSRNAPPSVPERSGSIPPGIVSPSSP